MDTHHSPPGSRWFRPGIALAALAVGLVAGGLGIAGAEEEPVPPADETVAVPAPFFAGRPGLMRFPGPDAVFHKRFGFGPGLGFGGFDPGGIHSEVTFENPEGKFQTTATQLGKVVAVSPTSITLESEDGYKRTYAVGEDTLVTAGRDGIGNLEKGNSVHLIARVEGSEARAVRIFDAAAMKLAHMDRSTVRKPRS
ncbi:MAG: hypothetical protein ACRD0O_13970 [Acidimicrobiia bacterium]